jgi:hypothetical protein
MIGTASNIGQVILSTSTLPKLGVSSLDSFSDSITGETGTRFFTKQFRYSKSGFFWSEWFDPENATHLSNVIAALDLGPKDPLFFQVRYTRAGTDDTGDLILDSFSFTVTQDLTFIESTVFETTPFNEFFTTSYDEEYHEWATAVLEKAYKRFIPHYIDRTNNKIIDSQDKNFVEFWRSIAIFFSIFVNYARVFDEFFDRESLLAKFLEQRGIYLCGDESLAVLQYLARNYYNEHRRRGTTTPLEQWSDGGTDIPGEIMRLICWMTCDDIVWNVNRPVRDVGWNLDVQSPMYRGLTHVSGVNNYEKEPFTDLALYPVTANVSLNGNDLLITGDGASDFGLSGSDLLKSVTVNPCYVHELYVEVKFPSDDTDMTMGLLAFDKDDVPVDFLGIDSSGNATGVLNVTGIAEGATITIGTKTYTLQEVLTDVDGNVKIEGFLSATAVLTGPGLPLNGQKVTVDGKIYTFQTVLTDVDGNVQIGIDFDDCLRNLKYAITLTGTPGTDYALSTTLHPTVTAASDLTSLTVTYNTAGTIGNGVPVSETVTGWSWSFSSLSGGTNSIANTILNLEAAIDLGPGAGTSYASSMTVHPTVQNLAVTASSLSVEAITPGFGGESIVTGYTGPGLMWDNSTLLLPEVYVINNYAFENLSFTAANRVDGEWYSFRMMIYGDQMNIQSVPKTMQNPLSGINLKFESNMCKVIPQITFQSSGDVEIRNLKLAISRFGYSRGFLQSSPWVETVLYNRNETHTYGQIQQILREYFIPYNSSLTLMPGDCSVNSLTTLFWEDVFDGDWISTFGDPLEWVWSEEFGISDIDLGMGGTI